MLSILPAYTGEQEEKLHRQYLPIRRRWSAGDAIRLEMDMSPQLLEANAHVVEDDGRAAVQRGPLSIVWNSSISQRE